MSKKLYVSPLFSGGLIPEEDPDPISYTNSQNHGEAGSETPDPTWPTFSGLSSDQISYIQGAISIADAWMRAGTDGVLSLEECSDLFPAEPNPE